MHPAIRGPAWLLVVTALVGFAGALYTIAKAGWSDVWPLRLYPSMAGCVYLSIVFLFVALKGRAPAGWIPWWSPEDRVADPGK